MRLVYAVFILLQVLMPSVQCQQTAGDGVNKGDVLSNQSKSDEAIMADNAAILLDLNLSQARRNKSVALDDLGEFDEVVKIYDGAMSLDPANFSIQFDPKDATAWNDRGLALYNQSNYDEAIMAYNEAIRLDPNYVEAWSNKGNVLKYGGKYDEAIKAYDEAIRLDPNLALPWYNKGVVLYNQGKYDDAIKGS